MSLVRVIALGVCLAFLPWLGAQAADPVHYDLRIAIDPAQHGLKTDADIALPAELAGRPVEFLLNSALTIDRAEPPVEPIPPSKGGFVGINGSSAALASGNLLARYRTTLPQGSHTIHLEYHGAIDVPLTTPTEEYTRSFKETSGLIAPEGIYLAGSTLWYPYFGDDLVSFRMDAVVPPGWELIGAGDGVSRDDKGHASWDSAGPIDEIHLVGGPLTRYSAPAGGAEALVYLHKPDPALAQKYLDATARYLDMYRGLIGPYPYRKFALVENFWETGYGMPSFTLLGPEIIRFPFILTSSYPHEILHNWWGNSVFPDYNTGNWSEGITAYLADHMLKEQQGEAAEYRRDTLKKYRDFVNSSRDFPLSEFRSRHSAATEAVGYGKTLMGFHMLRMRVGDEAFRRALAGFYRKHRAQRASFTDIRTEFEAASHQDLQRFFREWVQMTGTADISVEKLKAAPAKHGFVVSGVLRQRQRTPFELEVPVAVTSGDTITETRVKLAGRTARFSIATAAAPAVVEVDPQFDVFRLLDPRETAPSVGQIFGDPEIYAVLPSAEDDAHRQAYKAIAESWAGATQTIRIVSDADSHALPPHASVWLFGRRNRLVTPSLRRDVANAYQVTADAAKIGNETLGFAGHSLVVVARHPGDVSKAVGWIVVDPIEAATGLGRKLPHYGKYSYLGFAGNEPTNVLKGEWRATDSPLRVVLGGASGPSPVFARRAPLSEIPLLLSKERMLGAVRFLADPAREGRGIGSAGLEQSADYIEREFTAAGLKPAGDNAGYRQEFEMPTGPDGKPHRVHNIVGYLQGTNPAFNGQAVAVSAHYDHLGFGWPDTRATAEGKPFNGADDNASGVAVLLELARSFAAGTPPQRSLVFIAYSAEEAGLLGSKYYVAHPSPVPISGIRAVVNMDTVGRLGRNSVSVLAAASATEWPEIFRNVSEGSGVSSKMIEGASQSSDQQSFINAGVPGVQIFSGVNLDYHRVSDTVDKIDGDGLAKVATLVRDATTYLANRAEPLHYAMTGDATKGPDAARTGSRKVSMGTVPDFAWTGPGVKVESIVPGSPAATAGMQPGDVLKTIAGEDVTNLNRYSEILKLHTPGERVKVGIERAGKPLQVEVTFQAR
jgi:hypothetical protein